MQASSETQNTYGHTSPTVAWKRFWQNQQQKGLHPSREDEIG